MNETTRELDDIVDRLAPGGTVTAADIKLIVHAMEHVHDGSSPPALGGPYWEARQKALLDRRSKASDPG
jgi:hypothetical protein